MRPQTMVLVVLLAVWAAPAVAEISNQHLANTFLSYCQIALDEKAAATDVRAGYCLGYLQGLLQGELLKRLPPPAVVQTAYGPEWKQWCLPEGVTGSQQVRVVLKYLTDHPGRLHEPTLLLVREAFAVAWPCVP
jgi:hypothetical protein